MKERMRVMKRLDKRIRIIDSTLRDGMHAMAHRFTLDQMTEIAGKLEDANIEVIEVSHGETLGGSSINYGFAAHSDKEYLKAVSSVLSKSKLAVVLQPGIGTVEDLKVAIDAGVKMARISTHATEADISEEHITYCKEVGLEAIGGLMMTHTVEPNKIVEQAKLMQDYGAEAFINFDSAGAMLPEEVETRITALKSNLLIPIGFHAHNNLGLAVGCSLRAAESGTDWLDGTLRGLGAGAGNAQEEVLVAVLEKAGFKTGVDLYKIMDAAEALDPMMKKPQVINNSSLMLGYAGLTSTFLLHAEKIAKKFQLDPRDILVELGRRKAIAGQEDWIIEVASELAQKRRRTKDVSAMP